MIDLNANDGNSRSNIERYIKELKNLPDIEVNLNVKDIKNAQQAVDNLNNSINSSKNSKLNVDTAQANRNLQDTLISLERLKAETSGKNGTLKIDTDAKGIITQVSQSFTNAKNEVEKIKFKPSIDIDGNQMLQRISSSTNNIVNKDAMRALEEFNRELDKLYRKGAISSSEKDNFLISSDFIKANVSEIKKLQQSLRDLGNETSFANKINNVTKALGESFNSLDEKLNTTLNKLGSNVDSSKLDVIRNKMNQLANTQIMNEDDIQKANGLIDSLNRRISTLSTSGNSMERFNSTISKATEALDKMEREGYASSHSIAELRKNLSLVESGNLRQAKDALKQVNDEMKRVSETNNMSKGVREVQNSILRLTSDLEKTVNLYRKSVNKTGVSELKRQINELSKLPLMNLSNITEAKHQISQVREGVKKLNADATTATRNSMSIIDAFKTAMSKFPV